MAGHVDPLGDFNLDLGELGPPDSNGLRLPRGFSSRVVARSGERVKADDDFVWHPAPDGGACFGVDDGGWIYVSNSEIWGKKGGASALRFSAAGEVTGGYSILQGTSGNCAGGATPWGTWLSCEEVDRGRVWECDPHGKSPAIERRSLGLFRHEAAAVDPERGQIYLTEDESDGRLYRFDASRTAKADWDLDSGVLYVAEVLQDRSQVRWHPVPNPTPSLTEEPTRRQVLASTRFKRAEGACFHRGRLYFTTTQDERVWQYEPSSSQLSVLYDDDFFEKAVLTGVDNITASDSGDLLVAEDGGDMQVVLLSAEGTVEPALQVVGHPDSEITGPALDPSGTRLYFSSQRGSTGIHEAGVTFEVAGPWTR